MQIKIPATRHTKRAVVFVGAWGQVESRTKFWPSIGYMTYGDDDKVDRYHIWMARRMATGRRYPIQGFF